MNTQSVFLYLTEEGVRQKRFWHLALKFRTTEHLPYADDSTAVTPKSEINGGIIVDTPTKIGLRYGHILSLLGRILRTQRLIRVNICAFSDNGMQTPKKNYCLKVTDSLNEEESLKSYPIESLQPFHVVKLTQNYIYI